MRRAARYDGLYPIEVTRENLQQALDLVVEVRGSLDGFDVIVRPDESLPYTWLEEVGVTWAITGPAPGDPGVLELASASPAELFGI